MNKSYRGTNFEMKWWVEVAFVYYEDRLDAKLENLQWRSGHIGMTLEKKWVGDPVNWLSRKTIENLLDLNIGDHLKVAVCTSVKVQKKSLETFSWPSC